MTRSEKNQEYFNKEDYQVRTGDRFSERLSFWITVVKILDTGEILTIESNKEDIQVYNSKEDFRYYCSYKSENMKDKYWIDYMGNNIEKTNLLLEEWKSNGRHSDQITGQRQVRIDQLVYNLY
jgi:hypothetical protein